MARKKKEDLRPQEYDQEIADSICEELAMGFSIRTVCAPTTMPSIKTFFKWLRTNEEFRKQYASAKEEAVDAMAEDIFDISDDGTNDWMEVFGKDGESIGWRINGEALQRSRLRVDTRKWYMSKIKPKKYGEKLDLTSDGEALPTPIYGGLSGKTNTGPAKEVPIPGHDSDQEDILPRQKN